MTRVNGVKKYASFLVVGLIAGLAIWLQLASSPLSVAAYKDHPRTNIFDSVQPAVEIPKQILQDVPAKPAVLDESNRPAEDKSGVLTIEQMTRLDEAARKYLAETPSAAVRAARSLNVVDNGDPTNICGPLSIAILRDAGVIDPYTEYRQFWLLNPEQSRNLLDETFPAETFAHYVFKTPLDEMDWKSFPLKAGDFLYIYAGPGGNFEHMLAVNRVDTSGRVYSITNFATPEGFIIGEVMLYDPGQSGMGKFYDWTDRQHDELGSTGYGGFELWRLNQPIREKSPREQSLAKDLDSVMQESGGQWYVAVKKLGGGTIYQRQSGVTVDIGSMVKLPVALLLFKSLENEGIKPEDFESYLAEEGPDRSYDQLLRGMFFRSEAEATQLLISSIRDNHLVIEEQLAAWGLKNTNIDSRKSTVSDIVLLYQGLYSGNLVSPVARDYILGMMKEAASGKYNRLGILQETNPASLSFYMRRGSAQDTVIAIGDGAIISVPVVDGNDQYIVVIMGRFNRDYPTTDEQLIRGIEKMGQVVWDFAR
jgi:hypothetical protein